MTEYSRSGKTKSNGSFDANVNHCKGAVLTAQDSPDLKKLNDGPSPPALPMVSTAAEDDNAESLADLSVEAEGEGGEDGGTSVFDPAAVGHPLPRATVKSVSNAERSILPSSLTAVVSPTPLLYGAPQPRESSGENDSSDQSDDNLLIHPGGKNASLATSSSDLDDDGPFPVRRLFQMVHFLPDGPFKRYVDIITNRFNDDDDPTVDFCLAIVVQLMKTHGRGDDWFNAWPIKTYIKHGATFDTAWADTPAPKSPMSDTASIRAGWLNTLKSYKLAPRTKQLDSNINAMADLYATARMLAARFGIQLTPDFFDSKQQSLTQHLADLTTLVQATSQWTVRWGERIENMSQKNRERGKR